MEEKVQKFLRIQNLILIGGITIAIIGILAMFSNMDKRIQDLEETINQFTLSEKSIVPGGTTLSELIQKPAKEEPEIIPESAWRESATFNGKEGLKTNSFSISGNQWRIKWELDLYPEKIGSFSFKVFQTKDDQEVQSVSFGSIPGMTTYSEGTYIYEGDTDYYLDIQSSNLKNWRARIETLQE